SAGDLDRRFGTAGKLLLDFGGDQQTASAVAVGKDGKIYAAGSFKDFGSDDDFLVARVTPNGRRDPTWGAASPHPGFVTTDFGGNDAATALAIQKDGKVVVGGFSLALAPPHTETGVLARYMPDGRLDT